MSLNLHTDPSISNLIKGIINDCVIDDNFTEAQLESSLVVFNRHYRSGDPLINDKQYDFYTEVLREINPENVYLNNVEPEEEGAFSGELVKHGKVMLSTKKCYEESEIKSFIDSVYKAAEAIRFPIDDLLFSASLKYDGMAIQAEDGRLASRGTGYLGTNLSRLKEWGVRTIGDPDNGLGELVVDEKYFNEVLAPKYDLSHPRTYISGLASSDKPKAHHLEAIKGGHVVIAQYTSMPRWIGNGYEFLSDYKSFCKKLHEGNPYLTDGYVVEVLNEELVTHLGATSHHKRSMIAIKEKSQGVEAIVKDIVWATGRTARITPRVIVEEITIGGSKINYFSGHSAGWLEAKKITKGSSILVHKAGEVIPSILRATKNQGIPQFPSECPSCKHPTYRESEFYWCSNLSTCPEQKESKMKHFTKTIGNMNGFGDVAIQKMIANGFDTPDCFYTMTAEDYTSCSISSGVAKNLIKESQRSLTEPLRKNLFLASMGIHSLGRSDSKKLLKYHPLETLENITAEQIIKVDGFGEKTATSIASDLREGWVFIEKMINLGFNFEQESVNKTKVKETLFSGKTLVFTGTMINGNRKDMQLHAEISLNAKISSGINGKTDYLIYGERSGKSKLEKAKELNVKSLSEDEYFSIINKQEPQATTVSNKTEEQIIPIIKNPDNLF